MAALPSGLVTFVFTDIEGSTRLFRSLGDRYAGVLERHNELLRSVWDRHGGAEVNTEGDAFFVAFGSAADAVAACVDAQHTMAGEPWADGAEVRVRIGAHTGLAAPRNGDYIALAVHQAARVVGAAHGGQILVSAGAQEAAGEVTGVRFERLGRFRIRDFDGPIDLFQVADSEHHENFPAVRATPAEGHNIPRPGDSFVGREADVGAIVELLSQHRVVSIVGPGGMGKSRLAVEVALRDVPGWADGVWLVALAPLSTGALVARTVAETLGVSTAGREPASALVERLQDTSALLVLDNCEHVLDAVAALVAELVGRCPPLGILTTTREPLALAAEVVWRLGPLQESGVELFVDRARAADARFAIDDDTLGIISAVCDRVDGLPLAIELAAARVDKLRPDEILRGLDDRFRLLRSRRRDLDERQRNLEALLDWSYDLLDEPERATLRRLSVFAGSFSLDGAEAAAGWGAIDGLDVPEIVWNLVDKSLVVPDTSDNQSRYRFLDTIRAYGGAKLALADEHVTTTSLVAEWLRTTVGPRAGREPRWLRDTRIEADNIRAVIDNLAAVDGPLAQELACALGMLHYLDSTYGGGIPELRRYLSMLPGPSPHRLALLAQLSHMLVEVGEGIGDEVRRQAEEHIARGIVEPEWSRGRLGTALAGDASLRGDTGDAIRMAEANLAETLLPPERAMWLCTLGIALAREGDVERAVEVWRTELEVEEHLDEPRFLTTTHGNLAEVFLRLGRHRDAAEHQKAALEIGVQSGMSQVVAYSLIVAARLNAAEQRWADAVVLHAAAEDILTSLGTPLYDEDQRLSAEMLRLAEQHVGSSQYRVLVDRGSRYSLPEVIDLAEGVLAPLAASQRLPVPGR